MVETKILQDEFYLGHKEDLELTELYEENGMLGDLQKLLDTYCEKDGSVVLPTGTKLNLVEWNGKQNCPAIYEIAGNGIQVIIYEWND